MVSTNDPDSYPTTTNFITRISLNVSYPLEILSFKIRANGLLMQNLATNVCLAISQFVIPIGIQAASWKFYFFFEGWLLIQFVVVYFFFIETRGATLEEINKTFDGAMAVEDFKAEVKGQGLTDLRDDGIPAGKGEEAGEHVHTEEIHEKTT
jgi:hypothetical protein